MTLVSLLVLIVVLGVIAYLVDTLVPMAPPFKTVFHVLLALFAVLLILQTFGVVTVPLVRLR